MLPSSLVGDLTSPNDPSDPRWEERRRDSDVLLGFRPDVSRAAFTDAALTGLSAPDFRKAPDGGG